MVSPVKGLVDLRNTSCYPLQALIIDWNIGHKSVSIEVFTQKLAHFYVY